MDAGVIHAQGLVHFDLATMDFVGAARFRGKGHANVVECNLAADVNLV